MKITTLSLNEVKAGINAIKKGVFAKVCYYSEPKTIDGSKLYKITNAVIRTKIDRTHKECYVEPTYHRNEDSEYLIDNALKTNNNTGNTLFCINPVWNQTSAKFYNEDGEEVSAEQAKAIIKPSKSSNGVPDFITVNAAKIISIG